jgi:hypothetical protein
MAATKRIPVSEETWKKLGEEKEPGQTWDELLEDMRVEKERARLARKIDKAEEGKLDTVALDDV